MYLGPESVEHLSLKRHFLELLPGFSVFFKMVLDLPEKVLISHNTETFVCDGSDNGVA